jgi:hypothetical protein
VGTPPAAVHTPHLEAAVSGRGLRLLLLVAEGAIGSIGSCRLLWRCATNMMHCQIHGTRRCSDVKQLHVVSGPQQPDLTDVLCVAVSPVAGCSVDRSMLHTDSQPKP